MAVYQPLQDYLRDRQEPSVVMSYAEIERVLGRPLPPTAYGDKKRQWWANTETHSQALAWLRANRKAKLNVRKDEVAFVRQEAVERTSAAARPSAPLNGLSASAIRMLEDVAEEKGVTLERAAADFINEVARRRRTATLDWFAGRSQFSEVPSADLVREDRDAR